MLKEVAEKLIQYYDAEQTITDPWQLRENLLEVHSFQEQFKNCDALKQNEIIETLFWRLNDKIYRHTVISWLTEAGFKVNLYGKSWEDSPYFKSYAQGELKHENELSKAYQTARFSLHLNPAEGDHQRLKEITLSLGKVLSRSKNDTYNSRPFLNKILKKEELSDDELGALKVSLLTHLDLLLLKSKLPLAEAFQETLLAQIEEELTLQSVSLFSNKTQLLSKLKETERERNIQDLAELYKIRSQSKLRKAILGSNKLNHGIFSDEICEEIESFSNYCLRLNQGKITPEALDEFISQVSGALDSKQKLLLAENVSHFRYKKTRIFLLESIKENELTSPELKGRLALAFFRSQEYRIALKIFKENEKFPSLWSSHYIIKAYTLCQLSRLNEAEEAIKSYLKHTNHDISSLFSLALIKIQQKENAESLRLIHQSFNNLMVSARDEVLAKFKYLLVLVKLLNKTSEPIPLLQEAHKANRSQFMPLKTLALRVKVHDNENLDDSDLKLSRFQHENNFYRFFEKCFIFKKIDMKDLENFLKLNLTIKNCWMFSSFEALAWLWKLKQVHSLNFPEEFKTLSLKILDIESPTENDFIINCENELEKVLLLSEFEKLNSTSIID